MPRIPLLAKKLVAVFSILPFNNNKKLPAKKLVARIKTTEMPLAAPSSTLHLNNNKKLATRIKLKQQE
ncbi:hypothetical protein [Siphonobacter sp. SORGH_AS_1065]|uniref:hypothetical protein n=1 Tax=Siphonobacter sp. SORGH_AS_1065 TaxID=3041795 RepID=UPI0027863897|nr:hypothetical protein [Siphonobacter sp. SORGH_AS_1065]MDQ1089605.1 hypothetical protein [Siphonobacter sp. SORGH_AS_1065]